MSFADASAAPRSRAFTPLFFVLVAAALLFSDKGQIAGDGEVRWRALVTLMDEGRLTPERFSLEMPLTAAPLWAVATGVARVQDATGAARLEAIRHVVQRFNKLVAFVIAAWLFARLRRLGLDELTAAGGVLILLFASLLVPHSKDFYSEPLWALIACVALGLLADGPARTRRGDFVLLVSTALAIPLNPLLAPVLLLTGLALWLAFISSKGNSAVRGAAAVAIGCALGTSLALLENVLRRGAALDFGYSGEGFTAHFFEGILGQLFSPARGALFYLPAFFLGLALLATLPDGEARRFVLAGTVFGWLLVLAYAKWHAWHGATYWGPRFLLPLSVLGIAFFALAWREFPGRAARAGLAAVALLSYAAYKAGVGIGVTPSLGCGLPGDGCYWQWARLPLASWWDPRELASMLSDRSTAVEAGTLVLFAALVLVTGRGRSRPAISPPGPAPRSG